MSQLMRLWYLSHRRPAPRLSIYAVPPEPSLFVHMKYGSRRRVRPKIRHLASLDCCACVFDDEFTEDEKYHNLIRWLKCACATTQWGQRCGSSSEASSSSLYCASEQQKLRWVCENVQACPSLHCSPLCHKYPFHMSWLMFCSLISQ